MSSAVPPLTPPPPDLPERPDSAADGAVAAAPVTAPWRPLNALLALAGFVGAVIAAGVAAGVITAVAGGELENAPPGAVLGGTAVQQIGMVVVVVLLARMAGDASPARFGLRPTRLWRAVGLGLALYFAYAFFTAGWTQIVEIPEPANQLDDLGVDASTAALIAALLVVCVGAPVVEELFFRGFVFGALRNWRGVWPAALITGVLFGGVHAFSSPVGALVPLAVLGVGLCLLFAWTGSLLPCVALHAINNAIAFGVSEDYGAGVVVLLVAGALAVCALILGPISRRRPEPPGLAAAPV